MIGKIVKGKSFKGCISYILGKEKAELLDREGVLLNDIKSIINSFYMQSLMNPNLAKSVGHIPLSYSKNDSHKLTDEFMVKLAKEYMTEMKIENTQYIIVRHHDTDHPHCHIVFNRVDNEGKTISDKNDHFRNEKVTKKLKEKYNLTFGEGKQQVNIDSLKEPDSTKYEIFSAIKNALKQSTEWKQFEIMLSKQGIGIKYKLRGQTDEVQGISFIKGDSSFKGSEIDRSFSYSKLDLVLGRNESIQQDSTIKETTDNKISHSQDSILSGLVDVASNLGEIFSIGGNQPPEQEEFNPFKYPKKKKKRRRFNI